MNNFLNLITKHTAKTFEMSETILLANKSLVLLMVMEDKDIQLEEVKPFTHSIGSGQNIGIFFWAQRNRMAGSTPCIQ